MRHALGVPSGEAGSLRDSSPLTRHETGGHKSKQYNIIGVIVAVKLPTNQQMPHSLGPTAIDSRYDIFTLQRDFAYLRTADYEIKLSVIYKGPPRRI